MPQAKVKQSLFYRINHWYDQISEPLRILIMFAIVVPGIFCVTLPGTNVWIAGSGMIWLIVVLIFRVLYVDGYIRKKE